MGTLANVLTVIEELLKFEPVIVQAGADLLPFAQALYKKFKGAELTESESAALEIQVDALYTRFMRPQSPAQPGDPDYVKPSE